MSEETGLATLLGTDADTSKAEDANTRPMQSCHPFGTTLQSCTLGLLVGGELDLLARAGHENQVEHHPREDRSEEDPSRQPWERLRGNLRESSRQQADHIPVKLRAIGCCSSGAQAGNSPVTEFDPEEVEIMARMEHARWNAERWLDGWTLGPRDHDKKTSPYLLPWDELEDRIQEYDRNAVRNILHLSSLIGEKVYRCCDEPMEHADESRPSGHA
ncbi:hypothetical protein LCGC14_2969080 [marine sediment metagenome]|uniref:Ryanodine receptor Ryr domain-containing protein n=1 Tax=marine sediment metagenome TaxID=412755 RepID=A0A0F8XA00_9ZZZZ